MLMNKPFQWCGRGEGAFYCEVVYLDNYKSWISEKESIWAFLCSLFTWKKNKCLI